MLGSDEGVKLGFSDGKVFGTIHVNVDKITLSTNVGTELGSLDGFFDFYNDSKF